MARGYTPSLMEECTKVDFKMVKDMAREPIFGRMGINILENGNMARAMDMAFSHGLMEKATQVNGKTANMTATEHTLYLMAEKELVSLEMINLGTSRIMIVSDILQEAGLKVKNNNN